MKKRTLHSACGIYPLSYHKGLAAGCFGQHPHPGSTWLSPMMAPEKNMPVDELVASFRCGCLTILISPNRDPRQSE